jgi:hypothetical protein
MSSLSTMSASARTGRAAQLARQGDVWLLFCRHTRPISNPSIEMVPKLSASATSATCSTQPHVETLSRCDAQTRIHRLRRRATRPRKPNGNHTV